MRVTVIPVEGGAHRTVPKHFEKKELDNNVNNTDNSNVEYTEKSFGDLK